MRVEAPHPRLFIPHDRPTGEHLSQHLDRKLFASGMRLADPGQSSPSSKAWHLRFTIAMMPRSVAHDRRAGPATMRGSLL